MLHWCCHLVVTLLSPCCHPVVTLLSPEFTTQLLKPFLSPKIHPGLFRCIHKVYDWHCPLHESEINSVGSCVVVKKSAKNSVVTMLSPCCHLVVTLLSPELRSVVTWRFLQCRFFDFWICSRHDIDLKFCTNNIRCMNNIINIEWDPEDA